MRVRTSLPSDGVTLLLSVLSYSLTMYVYTCMWLVTSVCLCIYRSLMYERVLEKCFGVLESPGNLSEQKSGNAGLQPTDVTVDVW